MRPQEERFKAIVASAKPSSLEDMRRHYPGHQDGRGHLREVPSFHLDPSLEDVRPVMGEIECLIKRFGGYETIVSKDSARAWAKENGYRYPFPWERDAFFASNPGVPDHYDRIVDLGSILDEPRLQISGYGDSHVCVRELAASPGARIFTSLNMERSAGIYCFLLVRK